MKSIRLCNSTLLSDWLGSLSQSENLSLNVVLPEKVKDKTNLSSGYKVLQAGFLCNLDDNNRTIKVEILSYCPCKNISFSIFIVYKNF